MKRKILIFSIFTVVLVGVVAIAPTLAAVSHVKGKNAYAAFSNDDGCINNSVSIYMNEGNSAYPAPEEQAGYVNVNIFSYDYCTGEQLFSGYGTSTLDNADFEIQPSLGSARLKIIIPVNNFATGIAEDVSIDMAWMSTGPTIGGNVTNNLSLNRGFKFHYHSVGSYREAQASGSVSLGTTNFTPQPSDFAQISRSNSGTIVIEKPAPSPSPYP